MDQLNQFSILQIVGYKNSGKTTLIQKVITELKRNHLKIGIFKHHGHGGLPVIHDEGTDTWKYRDSGASVTAVEGAGFFQLTSDLQEMNSLDTIISIFRMFPLNGLILEGFKEAAYPKVLLIKTEADLDLINKCKNIITLIYWDEDLKQNFKTQLPQFSIFEEEAYISFIVEWLKGVKQ